MELHPDKILFQTLLTEFQQQKVRIPEFQRDFVWNRNQIKKLLDSIYNQYPIGSFIFWTSTKKVECVKKVGNYELSNAPPEGHPVNYVIDGQQRILSLIAAIKGASIDDESYKFYFDIENKEFLNEKESEEKDPTKIILLSKLFLNNADYSRVIRQYNEEYFELLNDLYLRFHNYPFSIIYVRDEDDLKKVCKVFHVINTTGKKLTPVSLVISKSWSEGFDLREKFTKMHNKFRDFGEIPEYRILQLAAVILHNKKCKKDIIINHLSVSEIRDLWEDLIKSLELSLDFLVDKMKVRNISYLPFDVVIVPLAYFYYKNNCRNETSAQREYLKKWFWLIGLARRYDSAVEGGIEKDLVEFDKILAGGTPSFNYNIGWGRLKEAILAEKLNFGSAFCKTILSLYSYNDPLTFKDGDGVRFISYSLLNRKNLHHFFPRNYIKNSLPDLKEYTNKIANFCFLPADQNIEISDDPPKEYIKEFLKQNKKFKETMKSHFIGDLKEFGIEDDNFKKFLDKRAEAIKEEFERLAG